MFFCCCLFFAMGLRSCERGEGCGAAESVGGIQGNWDGVGVLRCLIFFSSLLVSSLFL